MRRPLRSWVCWFWYYVVMDLVCRWVWVDGFLKGNSVVFIYIYKDVTENSWNVTDAEVVFCTFNCGSLSTSAHEPT